MIPKFFCFIYFLAAPIAAMPPVSPVPPVLDSVMPVPSIRSLPSIRSNLDQLVNSAETAPVTLGKPAAFPSDIQVDIHTPYEKPRVVEKLDGDRKTVSIEGSIGSSIGFPLDKPSNNPARPLNRYMHRVKTFIASAESGNHYAQKTLGDIYADGGLGGKKDTKLASYWYYRSALQGNRFAAAKLQELAKTGDLAALTTWGQMKFGGGKLTADIPTGLAALWTAAERGYQPAIEQLNIFGVRNKPVGVNLPNGFFNEAPVTEQVTTSNARNKLVAVVKSWLNKKD